MPRIQLPQVLAGPVVRGVVVHVDLFPDAPAQEGDRVAVPFFAARHRHGFSVPLPLFPRHRAVRRPVIDLPVFHGVRTVVDGELFLKIALQRLNPHGIPFRHRRVGAEERLLLRVGMGLRELVVLADDADRGVNPVAGCRNFGRELGAVAVADDVGAPFFRKFQGQLFIARFARKGEIPAPLSFHIHTSSLFPGKKGGRTGCPAPGVLPEAFRITSRWRAGGWSGRLQTPPGARP